MTYRTVFDAAQSGFTTWYIPAFGLILVFIGLVGVLAPDLLHRPKRFGLQGRARTIASWCFLIFAIFSTFLAFALPYGSHRAAGEALESGNYAVVEGPVTDFIPMPATGHSMESFTVDGKHFSYADAVLTGGFNNTASHGGPIKAGLYVRITYRDNVILRLEIAQ